MTASSYTKMLKQLITKPAIMKRFLKHNKPKDRKFGINVHTCERCGRRGGHISKYGINLCRQCFRETAIDIGFKKYN